jgi:DNA polymerase-4
MVRKILHIDLDAFFCSVEENNNPSLRGKPFAVGGRPGTRGVVASCSYAARMYGVHSAMPTAQALRLCPDLIIISGKHGDYGKISEQVMDYLATLTPLIEQVSIDEAFLDLSDLPEVGEVLAKNIQATIHDQFHLPCSIGVSSNKLMAKIATDVGKSSKRSANPPQAITVIPTGQEEQFLAPLSTKALWGIGPKTASRLYELGIHTIGDIANMPRQELIDRLGKFGLELEKRSRGIDDSPVSSSHEIKSVSNETTFDHDITEANILHETLHSLSESVGRRLRKHDLKGNTVKLKLRWYDFTTLTRQMTLPMPTNDDREIYAAVKELFTQTWIKDKPVRLLGVGVTHFAKPDIQMGFWDSPTKDNGKLSAVVDTLRDRYGRNAIIRGSDLKRNKTKGKENKTD